MKRRSGDGNVGRLIVFSVVIIIGVAVFGIYSYKFSDTRKKNNYLSVLSNSLSNLPDLQAVGICKTSTSASISYNPVKDKYYLKCSDELGLDIGDLNGLINIYLYTGCGKTDKFCEYKIRK